MHILHHKENVFYPDIHAQSTQGPKKGCILSSTSGGGGIQANSNRIGIPFERFVLLTFGTVRI